MIKFYNFNNEIRNTLNNFYFTFAKKDKKLASSKFYELIENLKLENYDLYKIIIGLAFLDNYRILKDKEKYDNLTSEEMSILVTYQEIEDIEDLLFMLEENPSFISTFIFGTIKFSNLNIKNQANLLLQTSLEFALKFNKFFPIEKYEMFKDRTKEDILSIYVDKNKNLQDKIYEIINILDVLFIGNNPAFSKLLLEMLQVFYKWKKVLQIRKPELTFGLDDNIIEIVETNSQDKILYILSCNPNLIEIIVTDFLEYESFDEELKKEIEDTYNKLVSNEIKIKLKEV